MKPYYDNYGGDIIGGWKVKALYFNVWSNKSKNLYVLICIWWNVELGYLLKMMEVPKIQLG